MIPEAEQAHPSLALNTALENDFVSPLTSLQGAIELLRDFPDMPAEERKPFFDMALEDCARLSRGIDRLAATVYAAGEQTGSEEAEDIEEENLIARERIRFYPDLEVVEIDYHEFAFTSASDVHNFYDSFDRMVEATGRKWYVVMNYVGISIWPEAWVAFAHRGKKVNEMYSLGTFRYTDEADAASSPDASTFASRDAVLAHIAALNS